MTSTKEQTSNQSTVGQTQLSDQDRDQQIARRAYELYLERGEGSDSVQNWLDAETEMSGSSAQLFPHQTQAATAEQES